MEPETKRSKTQNNCKILVPESFEKTFPQHSNHHITTLSAQPILIGDNCSYITEINNEDCSIGHFCNNITMINCTNVVVGNNCSRLCLINAVGSVIPDSTTTVTMFGR